MRHTHTLRPGLLATSTGMRRTLETSTIAPFREVDGFELAFSAWLITRDEQRARKLHAPAFRTLPTNPALDRVLQIARSYPPPVTRPSYPPTA